MTLGIMLGLGGYVVSGSFLGIRAIPYKLCLGFASYYSGLYLGMYTFGNKNHQEVYTVEEFMLLKE